MENNIIVTEDQLKQMGVQPGQTAGQVNMMGLNIDLSKTIGDMLADQYIAQLTPENVKTLMDFITQDLFTPGSRYDSVEGVYKNVLVVKEGKKNNWGEIIKYSIGEMIRTEFNKRIEKELIKKVEEIIATTDYQERIDKIANDLVDYSITGYADDMKNRIRERLVGGVIDPYPTYGGMNLKELIHQCINERMG